MRGGSRFLKALATVTACVCASALWHLVQSPLHRAAPLGPGAAGAGHNRLRSLSQQPQDKERTGLPLETYQVADLPAPIVESSYECSSEEEPNNRVCFFHNVFLWQGGVVFVSHNASLEMPTVPIDFRVISGLAFTQPKVMTPEQLAAARQSATAIIDWTIPKDEVHVWSGAVKNYGHFLGEDMPSLHNTLCKYLGRCAPGNTSGLHLVLLRERMFNWAGYVNTAMACMSESRLVNIQAQELQGTLFAVRRLFMGVGSDCRGAVFCRGWGKVGISPQQYAGYRQSMAACLGFDAAAAAPVEPKLKFLVVDRLYSSGRHFLNIQEMMMGLRERYGAIADIELRYLEHATLLDQVEVWSGASVAIHMHGASLGNWGFLPHHAAGVHITMDQIGNPFPQTFVEDLTGVTDVQAVMVNVSFVPNVVLRLRQFEQTQEWREELTMADKLQILERGDCNISKPDDPQGLSCEMKYLLKGFDMVVPLQQLYEGVDRAVELVYSRQGRTPPSWVLTGGPDAAGAAAAAA